MTNDRTYRFCLRFFAELRAMGVTDAVISPGSRSTPLALSARAAGLRITIELDERVGAFHALGQSRATGVPSVLICTSGTAGANYLPAVIEAHHSDTAIIVCTADRPPELRQWGAGQTIDQVQMYGSNVRWFHELPVAGEASADHAAAIALRALTTALHGAGPVHLNWPFREPLEPQTSLAPPRARLAPPTARPPSRPSTVLAELGQRFERGLIVAGPADLHPRAASEILAFSHSHGWPVVADPASGLRAAPADAQANVVTSGEFLFASASFTGSLPPCDVVVRVGLAPTSKSYRLWLESNRPARLVLVAPSVEWADPTDSVTDVVSGPVAGLFGGSDSVPRQSEWSSVWAEAEKVAAAALTEALVIDAVVEPVSELAWTSALIDHVGGDVPAVLVASSSMPIRDVDATMRRTPGVRMLANRGANGIDGVIATASGVAQATSLPTWALMGDIATVHDLGGLAAAARLGIANLTVVVIDNDEGGIFSFLPVARSIDADAFRELFATPHGTDLAAVGAALGYAVFTLDHPSALTTLPTATAAPRLIVVRTQAADTVAHMARLRTAVDTAWASSPRS